MNEFGLIARYFDWPAPPGYLGGGDDGALVPMSAGRQLVVSVDMMVEGRHFFPDVDPTCLARKVLAVNLSDMAAMGAEPTWFTLALALPEIDVNWLGAFSLGLREMADEYGVALIGGDTTRGPLTLSIQIAGEVPAGAALLRSGGRLGDDIWVSGELGAAAAAVMHRLGRIELLPKLRGECDLRLDLPVPRIPLGIRLRGLASAALDISDGLVADLGHICERSGCGAEIYFSKVPFPQGLCALPEDLLQQAVLAGGDDYELCFTAPVSARGKIEMIGLDLGMRLTRIGSLVEGRGVRVLRDDATVLDLARTGFDHFS